MSKGMRLTASVQLQLTDLGWQSTLWLWLANTLCILRTLNLSCQMSFRCSAHSAVHGDIDKWREATPEFPA